MQKIELLEKNVYYKKIFENSVTYIFVIHFDYSVAFWNLIVEGSLKAGDGVHFMNIL